MKIVIASDSYKGSLDSLQVNEAMRKGILRVFEDAEIICIPIADGGEGTVDAVMTCCGGSYCYEMVTGPDGREVIARYGILPDKSAVIEMAAASGLPLVQDVTPDTVMNSTTYGTGQLIASALDKGCRKIYIGIGGSATNDGGIGMLQALGVSFLDADNREVGFGGKYLDKIARIDISNLDPRIRETELVVMSDVTNPLCGENGAAVVYGPQKGATEEEIAILDKGLAQFAELICQMNLPDIRNLPGAGAAGGLGGGLVSFLGAEIRPGIKAILEIADFEKSVQWADLILSGEGRIDGQSANGKVVSGIAEIAGKYNVPVIAICGSVEKDAREIFEKGISGMEAAVCRPVTLEKAMEEAEQNVIDAAERVMQMVKAGMEITGK
ncbi:MAG TPA: glycerate kinase [Candidatus Mediterraneibacter vanvlietii]|nr:glycerate kinase [Candidatus Mediterraneibacter vanvlietii]